MKLPAFLLLPALRAALPYLWLCALLVPARADVTLPPLSLNEGSTQPAIATVGPTGNFPLSGLDEINPFSRKLVVSIPIFEINGGGDARHLVRALVTPFPWNVTRTATYFSGGGTEYRHQVEDASSFAVKPGYGPGLLYYRVGMDVVPCNSNSQTVSDQVLTRFTFHRPEGGETELRNANGDASSQDGRPFLNGNTSACSTGAQINRGSEFVSSDGSATTFLSSSDVYDFQILNPDPYNARGGTGTLAYRNGLKYSLSNGLVSQIVDRNGNTLTFGYDGYSRVTSVSSRSASQSVSVTYDISEASGRRDEIAYKGSGGVNRVVKVHYRLLADTKPSDLTLLSSQGGDFTSTQTVENLFPDSVINVQPEAINSTTFNPFVIESVELPDGRKYELRYNRYAEVVTLRLPTGGLVEYVHGSATAQKYPSDQPILKVCPMAAEMRW